MANKLSNNPKNTKVIPSQGTYNSILKGWFYEEPKGLYIVVEIKEPDELYSKYVHVLINWRMILSSVSRYVGRKITK